MQQITGEHPCQSGISVKLFGNFIEIALRHGCSPVNVLHIFRTLFYKNTYGGLLLESHTANRFLPTNIAQTNREEKNVNVISRNFRI